MIQISQEMIASFPAEEVEAIQRTFIAAARAEDSAMRAEGLGERELFISGFGSVGAQELAEALRLRARRLRDSVEARVARLLKANEVATHAAADAVAAVENQEEVPADGDDDGSRQQPPRRGRPPKPREV
jgi:hypothetical protein